ncbi:unnamed protein product [Tetraodon nigroviridis]|uniref:(spotted green pufferfish) hypothetical protein n=1 Tax=Tetraodon nigroviridis TaxID=99883 RepID=Q4SSH1_TETNG|nr:unnamed protein product [Tetraodon nigroviridis]
MFPRLKSEVRTFRKTVTWRVWRGADQRLSGKEDGVSVPGMWRSSLRNTTRRKASTRWCCCSTSICCVVKMKVG